MTPMARRHPTQPLLDASVVTVSVDIAGASHEVLPPRRALTAGVIPQPPRGAEPS
ncbi:hypothetical protein JNB62_11215 [Microbacterium jejuense]|uniref:Uncharacterized protein n=1 Tax=Microbacterium jejuense TaxID=1263637 RepID=A0ABS7HQF6_9MICO|nr:hypothetical protein [Microbacterium jejuense]MBW9094254.1 hypothetical protein [Microbacterium jejuense]